MGEGLVMAVHQPLVVPIQMGMEGGGEEGEVEEGGVVVEVVEVVAVVVVEVVAVAVVVVEVAVVVVVVVAEVHIKELVNGVYPTMIQKIVVVMSTMVMMMPNNQHRTHCR